jgi:methylated-DNA-[protein]-cysteine S-methyltransferase
VRIVQYAVDGWGVGELALDGDVLLHHELPSTAARRVPGSEPQSHPLAERFRAYFAGERVSFEDVALDDEDATPFQRAIAAALRAVPYGEVVSYGELALLAGHPRAQRAAGTFCAHNRFPIVVPCHRVVAANGIGSYGSSGVAYKRRLLELERVVL